MWKLSAATILCVPDLCTKERIAEIKGTPFYKDPTYQPVGINASKAHNKLIPYSRVVSTDWGRKSSDLREDDARMVCKIMRALLTTRVQGTPPIFIGLEKPFSDNEFNEFLGFKSMSENAKTWVGGGWWHHQVADGVRWLLEDEADLRTVNRVTEHEDYAPYGKPEQVEKDEGLNSEDSDTESDSSDAGMSQRPSLGAYGRVLDEYAHTNEYGRAEYVQSQT